MNEKKYLWYKIANSVDEISFTVAGLAEIEVNNKMVCVALHNNTVYACTQKCPHAGACMADGYVDAIGNIVCGLHGYKFSLKNGRNSSGEGYYLKTFPIEMRKEGVFIQLEEDHLFK